MGSGQSYEFGNLLAEAAIAEAHTLGLAAGLDGWRTSAAGSKGDLIQTQQIALHATI